MLADWSREQRQAISRRRSKLKFSTLSLSQPRPSAEAAAGEGAYPGARPEFRSPQLRGTGKRQGLDRQRPWRQHRGTPKTVRGLGCALEQFSLRQGAERPYLGQASEARSRASAHAAAETPTALSPGFQRRRDPASAATSPSGSRPPPPPPPGCLHRRAPHAAAAAAAAFSPP